MAIIKSQVYQFLFKENNLVDLKISGSTMRNYDAERFAIESIYD